MEGNPENRTDPSGHCYCDVPGSGDNFFPQSGGRLLDGETGDVYTGPGYSYSYHLASWTGRRHHYASIPPRSARSSHQTDQAGAAHTDAARQFVGHLAYLDRQYDPVVDFMWLHSDLDPTRTYRLAHMYVEDADMSDPNNLMFIAGMTSGYSLDRNGQLTDGNYTVNDATMAPHMPSTAGPDKSVFLSNVDAHTAVLDAARFADTHGRWVEDKAPVYVLNGPVGIIGRTRQLTNWITVTKKDSGLSTVGQATLRND